MDDRKLERLRWRCRRGLLELDVLLLNFLEQRYPHLSLPEQNAFDKLLAIPDDTLFAYLQSNQKPLDNELRELVEKIKQ
ncbi:MAG: succinate dehydrogenase assembly factor 2 [Gammaproteobacteria bacterium]|nr:succinate dehydrogenase assembly factor 2 [Gammaproteobacteria bacterium]